MTPARRVDIPVLRAAWWTWLSLRRTKRQLRRSGLNDLAVAAPPPLPAHAGRGVRAVLRRQPHTCLERALVLQRWLEAHGQEVDVVIGVTSASKGFSAHAWLDGEAPPEALARYQELTRVRGHAGP